MTMSIRNGHVRWAFDLKSWRCTLNDIELATACIQAEEKERLSKFVYLDDFKASIIGRLLMRRFIKSCLPEMDYNAIHFERDARGKPFFRPQPDQVTQIDFNVSHHERYAVLAGSLTLRCTPNDVQQQQQQQQIGVDVMSTKYSGGKPLNEFFRIMHRTFTPNEWHFIKARSNENQQTAAFMRHWCLKESYVKNIGVGITINLQSIDFQLSTEYLNMDNIVRNSMVSVDRKLLNNWAFEESMLDDDHCIAVAVKNPSSQYFEIDQNEYRFQVIDFETLMQDAIKIRPLLTIDTEYSRQIFSKELKKTS